MAKKKSSSRMWDGITEEDFENGAEVVDKDIGKFNEVSMQIYGVNNIYARQLSNLIDSLKPVERRILYAMYKMGALPGKNTKCAELIAASMKLHNHGDQSIYKTMVGMIQNWKKAVPYIDGPSNFGSINNPEGFAAYRYSEACLSKYAMECFFSDFDLKAIGTLSFLTGVEEPKFLPCKFPNVLVNGTSGVGYGHSAMIPPFNITDIIELCKRYMKNPNAKDMIVYPDLPTGCLVVDEPEQIKSICLTGRGNLRMRAAIDIEETPSEWRLVISKIPYGTNYAEIKDDILKLGKSGTIKMKHLSDESEPFIADDGKSYVEIKLVVRLDKSLDPVQIRSLLYKATDLEKTIPVIFKTYDDLKVKSNNLKGLVLDWINKRRLYKRSLYNHKINKLSAQIEIRDILIELTEKRNLEKTVEIVKNNNTSDLIKAFVEEYGMSSYQAKVIADMRLSAFTKDAHEKYIRERKSYQEELDEISDIAYNIEKIDKIILKELDDLRKYGPAERRSPIVTVEGEESVSNTDHILIFTEQGLIKKLPQTPDRHHQKNPFGSFAQGDVPKRFYRVNNLDSIFVMDTFGRYTVVPVHNIPNTVYSSPGEKIYDVLRLEGNVIFGLPIINPTTANKPLETLELKKVVSDVINNISYDNMYVISLSESGMVKKTKLSDYIYDSDGEIAKSKGTKGAKARNGDKFVSADIHMPSEDMNQKVLVYTQKGMYVLISTSEIPELNKDTSGLSFIVPEADDKCAGLSVVFPNTSEEFIVVLTERGFAKKIECKYLMESKKRKDVSYLITVDEKDKVIYAAGCNSGEKLYVTTKSGETAYDIDSIPNLARKAKGIKIVPVPNGDIIINACVDK